MHLPGRAKVVLAIAFTILVIPKSSPAQRRAEDADVQVLDSAPGRTDLYPANADAKKEISIQRKSVSSFSIES